MTQPCQHPALCAHSSPSYTLIYTHTYTHDHHSFIIHSYTHIPAHTPLSITIQPESVYLWLGITLTIFSISTTITINMLWPSIPRLIPIYMPEMPRFITPYHHPTPPAVHQTRSHPRRPPGPQLPVPIAISAERATDHDRDPRAPALRACDRLRARPPCPLSRDPPAPPPGHPPPFRRAGRALVPGRPGRSTGTARRR